MSTLTSNELTPKQLAAVLRTLARGYHVDSGALEALNAAALIVEKATPAPETEGVDADASRFRWLTADISSRTEREQREEIFERMCVMSHSAASAAIDAAMLEYCPDRMSAAQKANWAAHQRPSKKASEGQS